MDAGLGDAAPGLGAEKKGDSSRLGLADGGDVIASLEGAAKPAATPGAPQGLVYCLPRCFQLEMINSICCLVLIPSEAMVHAWPRLARLV